MKKVALFTALLLCSFTAAFSQIYTYSGANTAGTPTYVDPNATATGLTAIGTGTNTPCGSAYSGITGFTNPAYNATGACIQVSMTANAGYTINATGFTVHIRSSTTGPTSLRLAYSTDGGATWVDDGSDYSSHIGSCATSIAGTNFVSWSPFLASNPSILFRVYPFGAPGSTGTVQIFDLNILGSVDPLCTGVVPVVVNPAFTSLCAGIGSGVTLTASGAGAGGHYTWSPAIGLSSATGASVVANPGSSITYTVTGTTSVGCHNTATAEVDVHALPSGISISASGPTVFCPGGSVLLSTAPGTGNTYQWFNGPTAIAGATGNSYAANANGDYTVTVTNSFGCSATSAVSQNVTVVGVPAAVITPVGSTSYCEGTGVELDAPVGAGYTYQWYNGSTPVAGATNSSYTQLPSATVTVRITNANGCSATSAAVTTNAIALPFLAPNGPTTFCGNGSVLLYVRVPGSATVPAGTSYQWRHNGADIPGAISGSYTANQVGDYECFVSLASGGCAATTAPVNIVVHAAPAPVVTFDGTMLSTPNVFRTYQWSVNGANITGATHNTLAPIAGIANGVYKVIVTDSNGCIGASAPVTATSTRSGLAVGTLTGTDVKIYPNPATTAITVEASATVRAIITAMDGKVVADQNDAHEINISNLANGLYIIMLYDEHNERIVVQKIVKQ